MKDIKEFALAMSEQLFEMRGEDLSNTILTTERNEQVPTDYIDAIMSDPEHQRVMKETINVSVLSTCKESPKLYWSEDAGGYIYTSYIYDHAYVVDAYIKWNYEKEHPEMKYIVVCDDCGGINVQSRAWVYPNLDNKFVDLMSEEVQDNWCEDCECNVCTTSIEVSVDDPKYIIIEE